MRRANKILMATVAILLCLVLITTSVVSGVFAKYAIKKQASTSVGLEKFGVKVTVTPDSRLSAYAQPEVTTGDTISITYSSLPLVPGLDFSKAINVKFEGTPTVNAVAQVIFHIYYQTSDSYADTYTKVPAGIGNTNEDTYFMPLGFTFGALRATDGKYENDYVLTPWMEKTAQNTLEETITKNIYNRLYFADGSITVDNGSGERTDYRIYKNFTAKTNIKLYPRNSSGKSATNYPMNDFDLGFKWPLNWPPEDVENTTGYDYDEICTYLAQNSAVTSQTITIMYTISIAQKS